MSDATYLTQDEAMLRDVAAAAVDYAGTLGADAASASASADGGARFIVSGGAVQTRLREGSQMLALTVFRGGCAGSASTAALDGDAVRRAVEQADAIARRVQPDADAGLADPAWLAGDVAVPPLFSPVDHAPDMLLRAAESMDAALAATPAPPGVTLSVDEAGAVTREMILATATSAGFCRSVASTVHARWIIAMARDADGAARDVVQNMHRRADDLLLPATLAEQAAQHVLAQLAPVAMAGGAMPVLFDARIAGQLIEEMVGALSGNAQYRRASFLLDAVGTPVMADDLDLLEAPFEPWGMASGAFDGEGVAAHTRHVVEAGVARGYFLSSLSARRLGLPSTGHAGGPWNLRLTSRSGALDHQAMLARMGRGLIVTHLLGGATDPVTGNWTRAVGGLRVEGGEVIGAVRDLTLAGSMPAMLRSIVAVGSDVERHGVTRCGALLIDGMTVGAAG